MSDFDWCEFFKLAEELSKKEDEASIRSAISRYYYSVFCSARYYLVEIKRETNFLDGSSIHRRVRKKLRKGNDNEADLADLLETLSCIRNYADYEWWRDDDYFKNELPIVQEKVKLAFENINALKENPSDYSF